MTNEKPRGLWHGWLGSLALAVLVAIATVVVTVPLTRMLEAQPQFNVKWDHGPFDLPPRMSSFFQTIEEINPVFPTETISIKEVLKSMRNTNAVMTFVITNVGDRPAEEVALILDGSGYSAVHRQDKTIQEQAFEKRLEIGRLAVGEVAEITIWSDSKFESITKPPLIVHNLGQQFVPSNVSKWSVNLLITIAIIGSVSLILLIVLIKRISEIKQVGSPRRRRVTKKKTPASEKIDSPTP